MCGLVGWEKVGSGRGERCVECINLGCRMQGGDWGVEGGVGTRVQGYLAHKKLPPPSALP